jgi:hypothetical protein
MVGTSNKLNFDGVSDRDGNAPPDTNASVVDLLKTWYEVLTVPTIWVLPIFGPAEISSIFIGVPGACGLGSGGF